MKSIKPYLIVSRDDTHKQQVTLANTNITIQLETLFQENKRTRDPEVCTVVGTYSEDYPVGMKMYVHYLSWAEWNEFYIPETQTMYYKIHDSCLMFEVRDGELYPLKGYCLGKQVTNPDRFHSMVPSEFRNVPLKDVAEIIKVHETEEYVSVGDYVATNKHGCGYTMELDRVQYVKVKSTDIEAILPDYKLVK